MSSAGLLAGLCGVLAALAIVDGACAGAPTWRRAAERRRSLRRPEVARRRREAARELLARLGVGSPGGLEERLAAAGISHPGATEQAMALKCAAALGAALIVLPVALRASPGSALLLIGGLPVAAFLSPDWLVSRRARRRVRLLRAQLPELLERVRLGAEAGLSPQRALALAAERDDGLLATELRAALTAIGLGMPAEQALRSLGARCPVPEVRALVAALRRSALHGAPLARAAGALAVSSRAERARRVHERAQGAAPKIQLVVALLLVPAALLLIAAALLAGMR